VLSSVLVGLFFLHAGTSPALSQLTLTVMLVTLGIAIIGISFGRLKTKASLIRHRWTLTAAVALTIGTVFFVMLPTAFRFYIDPDVQVLGSLSLTTVVHGVLGVFASVTALIYVLGDLPSKVKRWMRVTAVLWFSALAMGVVLFLQMLSLI
jgi:hypothetical protein